MKLTLNGSNKPWMLYPLFWFVLSWSLSSCSVLNAPMAGLAHDDHLIVPGERIGPVHLGMSEQDLLKLGSPSAKSASPSLGGDNKWEAGTLYTYSDVLYVWVEKSSHRVARIAVGSDGDCGGYHTAEGVTCGTGIYTLLGNFGSPTKAFANPFNHKIIRYTYANYQHSPRSITVYDFCDHCTMADVPRNKVEDIALYAGTYGDYFLRN